MDIYGVLPYDRCSSAAHNPHRYERLFSIKCDILTLALFSQVMIQIGLQEVPAKHVLKHWKRDARDILPSEFIRYQKDKGPLKYS